MVLVSGRVFCKKLGRDSAGDKPSIATFFASSSATSFPITPLCPGTQWMVICNSQVFVLELFEGFDKDRYHVWAGFCIFVSNSFDGHLVVNEQI